MNYSAMLKIVKQQNTYNLQYLKVDAWKYHAWKNPEIMGIKKRNMKFCTLAR